MTDATRAKALAKFERFTHKIGYPDKFRDYSAWSSAAMIISATFAARKLSIRTGGSPAPASRWTAPNGHDAETVNAYFNSSFNEIVFPAGILQPPFST